MTHLCSTVTHVDLVDPLREDFLKMFIQQREECVDLGATMLGRIADENSRELFDGFILIEVNNNWENCAAPSAKVVTLYFMSLKTKKDILFSCEKKEYKSCFRKSVCKSSKKCVHKPQRTGNSR